MPPKPPPPTKDHLRQILLELARIPGPPGYEGPIREELHKRWSPLADHVAVSSLGNLVARLDGTGPTERPSLAFVAHMDTIALMVRGIDHGFLHVSGLGTIDPRVLLGQPVQVLGRQTLDGILVRPPDSCLPEESHDKVATVEQLLVDLGRDAAEVSSLVRPGDLVVFDVPAKPLGEDLVTGPGLDNRASLAALTATLEMLHEQRPAWDVWAVATTREEQSLAGAATAGFDLQPQIAVVIDVTFGRGPNDDEEGTFPLGAGLSIGTGPTLHPEVRRLLIEAAEWADVPLADEVLPRRTGTDADSLHVAGVGIPTGLLGIPVRNMHTCVELVHVSDVARAARLIAACAQKLDASTVSSLESAFNDD